MTVRKTWRLAMPMYNVSVQVTHAWEDFLTAVIAGLRIRGWTDAMEIARPPADLTGFWRSPDVLLAQTCGYPYVTQLCEHVRLIATPTFDLPGCNGFNYSSYFVVREDSGITSLEALRGKRAVINQQHSQSGMNALRYAVAPLAYEGRFFGSVQESGAHLTSLEFVRRGDADVAAIDCVTFGLAQRHAPKWVAGIRVLHTSESTPGLPLISSAEVTNQQANDLLDTLKSPELSASGMLKFLGVSGFTQTHPRNYKVIRDQVERAELLGYPQLR